MIESIWNNFHQQLFNFIQSKVNDHALAEDILQNVFIKVHSNIDSLTSADKLQSWLYQICRNAIIDYYRQKRLDISDDDPDMFIAENQNAYDRQQLNRCLRILIADLPENSRDILIDSELEQVQQKTIAKNNGLSLASVKSRIQRGRVQLKHKLQACCDFEFKEGGPELNCKNQCGCER
ncbi:RNA polymerase sigma factor SigZ [Thalassotalea sp. ND16A]|uniref:RNA polymerase sigma factor SigZ n=1 Tax=Thalassotalea sp. ND16A TaxID=1535422 RepID=UPI00051CDD00|nr:RNA polymerase sigma factor SigZ [Thalassotalea sp. ND16A]KGJ90627.1 RNA polymerase, sigma-24 subunit, ECF subfamily [Thalassotalea sp. ND16A]